MAADVGAPVRVLGKTGDEDAFNRELAMGVLADVAAVVAGEEDPMAAFVAAHCALFAAKPDYRTVLQRTFGAGASLDTPVYVGPMRYRHAGSAVCDEAADRLLLEATARVATAARNLGLQLPVKFEDTLRMVAATVLPGPPRPLTDVLTDPVGNPGVKTPSTNNFVWRRLADSPKGKWTRHAIFLTRLWHGYAGGVSRGILHQVIFGTALMQMSEPKIARSGLKVYGRPSQKSVVFMLVAELLYQLSSISAPLHAVSTVSLKDLLPDMYAYAAAMEPEEVPVTTDNVLTLVARRDDVASAIVKRTWGNVLYLYPASARMLQAFRWMYNTFNVASQLLVLQGQVLDTTSVLWVTYLVTANAEPHVLRGDAPGEYLLWVDDAGSPMLLHALWWIKASERPVFGVSGRTVTRTFNTAYDDAEPATYVVLDAGQLVEILNVGGIPAPKKPRTTSKEFDRIFDEMRQTLPPPTVPLPLPPPPTVPLPLPPPPTVPVPPPMDEPAPPPDDALASMDEEEADEGDTPWIVDIEPLPLPPKGMSEAYALARPTFERRECPALLPGWIVFTYNRIQDDLRAGRDGVYNIAPEFYEEFAAILRGYLTNLPTGNFLTYARSWMEPLWEGMAWPLPGEDWEPLEVRNDFLSEMSYIFGEYLCGKIDLVLPTNKFEPWNRPYRPRSVPVWARKAYADVVTGSAFLALHPSVYPILAFLFKDAPQSVGPVDVAYMAAYDGGGLPLRKVWVDQMYELYMTEVLAYYFYADDDELPTDELQTWYA